MRGFDAVWPTTCDGCGLCCETGGSPVLVYQSRHGGTPYDERPPGLPQALIDEIDHHFLGLWRGQEPREPCLWYDREQRACKHYTWRPRACREYALGGIPCVELRRPHVVTPWSRPADREP